jgi:CysZ protein
MELLISFALWLLSIFVPPLIFITFPLGLIAGWYFIGFSIMDYNCERYRYSMSKSIQFIKTHKGHAIGIGCVYSLFMALPTVAGDAIGIMFGPTLAVIGATMSFLKINEIPSPGSLSSQPS